jgi:hypothetical protein
LCGAELNPAKAFTVHIVGGGGSFLHPADEDAWDDDPGADMGCWDLGSECVRLVPAAFRSPYNRGA